MKAKRPKRKPSKRRPTTFFITSVYPVNEAGLRDLDLTIGVHLHDGDADGPEIDAILRAFSERTPVRILPA